MLYLSSMQGCLILHGDVESLHHLDGITFNPNTHGPINAVRNTFDR